MTRMAFGTGEGVDVLVVVLAFVTGHIRVPPDRLGKVGLLLHILGDVRLLVDVFLHRTLLSRKSIIHTIMLAEVVKISSLFSFYSTSEKNGHEMP